MTVAVGAPLGVVSLWNVNDAATAELMKAFYQNFHRGLQKDEALRQAKLHLIKSPQPPGIIPTFGPPSSCWASGSKQPRHYFSPVS